MRDLTKDTAGPQPVMDEETEVQRGQIVLKSHIMGEGPMGNKTHSSSLPAFPHNSALQAKNTQEPNDTYKFNFQYLAQ